MAQSAQRIAHYITPEEHEEIERQTGIKHEWHDGEVFAMAGAAPAHNTIAANVSGILYNQLRGKPCEPLGSDQQVKIPTRPSVVYPDITISCPPAEYDERHRYALTNPRVVIEVLSPSTDTYDRVAKFDLYKRIPTLTDYVLISSDQRRIEHFSKQSPNAWTQSVASDSNECIAIESISCRLCLDDVYERLQIPDSAQVLEEILDAEGEKNGISIEEA